MHFISSFHETGIYDVTANIDYVLETTGFSQLHYIAYSMGATQLIVAMSEIPEYNGKIRLAVFIAPGVFAQTLARGFANLLVPFAWVSEVCR